MHYYTLKDNIFRSFNVEDVFLLINSTEKKCLFNKDLLDDTDLSNLVPGTIDSGIVSSDETNDGKK